MGGGSSCEVHYPNIQAGYASDPLNGQLELELKYRS